ncbi:hypothetical protein [Aquiflexum balticum]|nr:hypothetical protein [Aquiflexum balticum]
MHLINICGGGQVIASKSATALILDRYREVEEEPSRIEISFLI